MEDIWFVGGDQFRKLEQVLQLQTRLESDDFNLDWIEGWQQTHLWDDTILQIKEHFNIIRQ